MEGKKYRVQRMVVAIDKYREEEKTVKIVVVTVKKKEKKKE